MTLAGKTFTIQLSPDEIEIITTALHGQYKTNKELYESGKADQPAYIYDHMKQARDLRNSFAGLINRSYMGIDA